MGRKSRGVFAVPDDARGWDGGEDPVDDGDGVDAVGDGVEGQQDAVGHHVDGDVTYVVGQDVVAAAQQGQGAGGGDEAEGGAGAGADVDDAFEVGQAILLGFAGGHDEPDDVVGDEFVDGDLVGGLLQGDEAVG